MTHPPSDPDLTPAQQAEKDLQWLMAKAEAKRYAESPEGINKAIAAKRAATIARRKPIIDAIKKQQRNWEQYQNEKLLWWRIQNTPDEILYEPFFRRLRFDDWSR